MFSQFLDKKTQMVPEKVGEYGQGSYMFCVYENKKKKK